MRQYSARHGCEETSKRAPKGDVCIPIRHAKGKHPARGEQFPGGEHRRARIGELLKGVPDRDGIESSSGDVIELANRHAKSHSTGELGGPRVDVEPFEGPPGVVRRAQEGADVAPDFESRASSTKRLLEAARLCLIRAPLICVKRAKSRLVRHLARIAFHELDGAFPRVAVNQRTAPALGETKRRCLRERDAVRERTRRGPGSQSPLMKLPQRLHLYARIVGARDLARVVGAADGAGGEVVGGQGCSGSSGSSGSSGNFTGGAVAPLRTLSTARTLSTLMNGFFIISELYGPARDIVRAAQEKIDPRLANTSVPHVTITGSSGVGPIPLHVPVSEMEEALAPIAASTAPIAAELGTPMRFMQTDIIVLPLDPHGPLRTLHERIATSGLPFQQARYPFTPHATLSFYVTLDAAQRRELLSVRVDEPVIIDRLQCYRTVDPLPAKKVLELHLTGE